MDSEKSINSFFEFLSNYFVNSFFNNFSALLLCKINVLDFFDMGDFYHIYQYREIPIKILN